MMTVLSLASPSRLKGPSPVHPKKAAPQAFAPLLRSSSITPAALSGAAMESKSLPAGPSRERVTMKAGDELSAAQLQLSHALPDNAPSPTANERTLPLEATPSLDTLFSSVVSRIAWGTQSASQVVHIQLGHAGNEVLVERNARGIKVRLSGIAEADRSRYRNAIERRFLDANVEIDEIEIE